MTAPVPGTRRKITATPLPVDDGEEIVVLEVDRTALEDAVLVEIDDDSPPSTGGGPAPVRLDDLLDVEAPPSVEGLLARRPDGLVAPISLGDVKTDVFDGDGPPPDVVPGAGRGDLYLDRLTGDLYRLD